MKTLSGIYATGLVKLTYKIDKICINGKLSVQVPTQWEFFCISVSNFTVLEPRIQTDFGCAGIRSSQVVLKSIRSRI